MLLLLGPILLPHRHAASDMLEDVDDEPFLTEAKVLPESSHIGKKAGALDFLKPDGVTLLAVKRGTATQRRELEDFEIAAGDRLVLSARESEILAMEEREGLAVGQSAAERGEEERIVAKAFVAPSRKGMRQRLAEQSDIRRSGIRVLGVSRHRHSPGPDLDAVMLRPADRLLVEGPVEAVARLGDDLDLINISETRARPFRRSKAPIALGALALVVVLAALDLMPIGALAMIGIAAILLTRCIDAQEAWASINGDLLILIFAMLAIGVGLEKTGAIEMIGRAAAPVLEYAPYIVVLVGIYALTSFLTEIVTNNAVAIVLTPIAINLAEAMQLDPRPLVVAIMFGASASFATPIGYQTNTLVYGAADYRFSDFLKIGIPMNIVVGAASCAAIALFMPV
jgi:Trk K+ transport system NAD-binding subunit